jgi:hypothetical protein
MSVFVKDIDLPFSCWECKGCKGANGSRYCNFVYGSNYYECVDAYVDERHPDCPFEAVPQRRLIDADRLIAMILSAAGDMTTVPLSAIINSIESAPTVIDGREDNG